MLKLVQSLAFAAATVLGTAAMAEPVKVSIANFGDHPALVSIVTGFKARMAELGYDEDEDVAYEYRHVNFDRTLVPQMLQLTESDSPDLILTITTAVGQASIRGIHDDTIPIVFGGVVDPVVAGIVPGWDNGSETHAGASMLPDMAAALSFVTQVVPGAKRIGTLFNPGEDNDITNIELIKEAAAEQGLEIVAVAVDNANDLPQRVQSFTGQVDAVYLIQSNVVQTSVPVVAQIAQRIKLPLFNSVYSDELKNELAGFHAINYERNGVHAADIADRILRGEKPGAIPVYVPDASDFISRVSPAGLAAVGLSVPEALKGSEWIIAE